MTQILVADDSEDSLALIAVLLEKGGFHVLKARGGAECLELAARYLPDVILLDIGMPEKDGVETVRKILGFDPSAIINELQDPDQDHISIEEELR